MNIADELRASRRRRGDSVALRIGPTSVTYDELDEAVDLAAATLRRLGVEPGNRVALMLGTTPTYVVGLYAVWRLGAVAVPVNTGLTAPEVAHELRDCAARALLLGRAFVGVVTDLRGQLPELEHVLVADTEQTEVPDGMSSWRAAVQATPEQRPDVEPAPSAEDGHAVAVLAYTSGTTGLPKGAMLTHAQLLANHAQMRASGVEIRADDVVFTPLPLFHIYGLNVGVALTVSSGATLVLMERFDPAGSLALVADGVTVILGAPTMFVAWLNTPGAEEVDLRGVRLTISGAAALTAKTHRRCAEDLGLDIREGYGLTEAAPVVTSSAHLEAAVPGSVGEPLRGVEVRIIEDSGADVEPGDPGLVLVRGDNVFDGYWQAEDATAEVLRDGWLHTGDIGYLDNGLLHLIDRATDLIIVSGFNVYPREVEEVLLRHPAIAQAVIIGVPHPYTGEAVKAIVVVAPGAELTADEVVEHCTGSLARFKRPVAVEFADELPVLPTGKVRRASLRP